MVIDSNSNSDSKSNSNLLQVLLDEAEKEEEQEQDILASVMSAVPLLFDNREISCFICHLDWSNHVSELNCEGPNTFFRMYRIH